MSTTTTWYSKHPSGMSNCSRNIWTFEGLETLPVDTKPRTPYYWSLGGRRLGKSNCARFFLERNREGQRQSDEHWNWLKWNVGETYEKLGGARMGFSEPIDTALTETGFAQWYRPSRALHWVFISGWKDGRVCHSKYERAAFVFLFFFSLFLTF